MNKLKLIAIFSSLFFFTLFFINKNVVFADDACEPYSCSGEGSYEKITACAFNTSSCGISDTEASFDYICDTGGASGSCINETIEGNTGCLTGTLTSSCTCTDSSGICGSTASSGDSCGSVLPYTGYCTSCTYNASCQVNPEPDTLGCCDHTVDPTPTPSVWCGDGICNNSETCSDCETDCGICSPPPGDYCGDGSCNNGETVCSCAGDGCTNGGPCSSSCDVSISPSSVSMAITDSNFTLQANVSNIQAGNVSDVEFSLGGNNVVTFIDPAFDLTSPYQMTVSATDVGTTTLTANVYMGGSVVCSDTVPVEVTLAATEAPDCSAFDITPASPTEGNIITVTTTLTDKGDNLLTDGSWETGTSDQWFTQYNATSLPVDTVIWPGSTEHEGRYYGRVARTSTTDPHVATDWIETGENLTGQTYTFRFLGKGHNIAAGGDITIENLLIQREPFGGDWSYGQLYTSWPTFKWDEWTEFVYDNLTFSDPGNGSTTSRLRVVLRPSPLNEYPVYYDGVELYKTGDAGIVDSTVKFFAILTDGNQDFCSGAQPTGEWIELGVGTPTGNPDEYYVDWDTLGIASPGLYTIAVNAQDTQGNDMTGNPCDSLAAMWTQRPNCVDTTTIDACTTSCTEDCGTFTLDQIPDQVTGVEVNGSTSGNVDLTSTDNLSITWNEPTINGDATINYYIIQVWDKDTVPLGTPPSTCNASTKCVSYQTNGPETTALQIDETANSVHGDNVYVSVTAVNSSCTFDRYSPWSSNSSYNLVANVSGNFYNDADAASGVGSCSGNTTGIDIGTNNPNSAITANINGTQDTSLGTTFSINNLPYAPTTSWLNYSNLSLSIDNSDPSNSLSCICPSDSGGFVCDHFDTFAGYANGLVAPSQDFFLTDVDLSNGPWWQAISGLTYGTTSTLTSIPDTCEPSLTCSEYLITQNIDGDTDSAGIPMTGGGSLSAQDGYINERAGGNQSFAISTTHDNMIKENYDYFAREVDLSSADTLSGTIESLPSGATPDTDATEVYYRSSSLIVDFTNNSSLPETVDTGRKIVIFVNGNITFLSDPGDQMINVIEGSFIAFIASGDIIFDASVGNTMSYPTGGDTSTSNIEGVFVADGNIVIDDYIDPATIDNLFIAEGTLVGWSGFSMTRTYTNDGGPLDAAINNENPTEIFSFRPDFNENIPDIMMQPSLVWQEVN